MVLPGSFIPKLLQKLAKNGLCSPALLLVTLSRYFFDHFRSHKFQKGLETADPETRIFTHVNSASSMKASIIRGRTG